MRKNHRRKLNYSNDTNANFNLGSLPEDIEIKTNRAPGSQHYFNSHGCPECGGGVVFEDPIRAEIVCRRCGLVLDDNLMDDGQGLLWDKTDDDDDDGAVYIIPNPVKDYEKNYRIKWSKQTNNSLFFENRRNVLIGVFNYGEYHTIDRRKNGTLFMLNCKKYYSMIHQQRPYTDKKTGALKYTNPEKHKLRYYLDFLDIVSSNYMMTKRQKVLCAELIKIHGIKYFHRRASFEAVILGICFTIMREDGRVLDIRAELPRIHGLTKPIYDHIKGRVEALKVKPKPSKRHLYDREVGSKV